MRRPLQTLFVMRLADSRQRWLRLLGAVLLTLVILLSGLGIVGAAIPLEPLPQPEPILAASVSVPQAQYRTVRRKIREGETAGEALSAMKAPIASVLEAADGALDRIHTGDELVLDYRSGLDKPFRIRLENDSTVQKVLELAGDKPGDRYVSRSYPRSFRVESGLVEMALTSSLWAAGEAAGLSGTQIMNLAGIFETEVDFNTELVDGAQFRLVADRLIDEAGKVRFGDIRGALLKNGGKVFAFLRVQTQDGKSGWYEPDGEGRKRPFLRSPLEFSRVTSGFSRGRMHPILKERRPHYGVDFGAPSGTPVRSVADGVVTDAGPHGGHGNYVEIRHDGPYATSYSHLSAILVKRGQKIRQGDLIGKVGSTGLSTGPHLHYQFMVNGKFVDPGSVVLPMTGGLSAPDLAAFQRAKAEVLPLLLGSDIQLNPRKD